MKQLLESYDSVAVSLYDRYVQKLVSDKSNFWALSKKAADWAAYFEKVYQAGLYIDGENITINSTGISFNYQAYKNLVLKRYPDAVFDIQLVREGDSFSFTKKDGHIYYTHDILNTFDNRTVVGGYCIIKIPTGEFIEIMSAKDFADVRNKAKTKNIWNEWYNEMCLKSILKRACKRHFRDVTLNLDTLDNENFDMSQEETLYPAIQTQIDNATTEGDLVAIWRYNAESLKTKTERNACILACRKRKDELKAKEDLI